MSVYSFFGIPSKERDQKLELEKNVKTEDGSPSCTQRQRHRRFQNQRRSSRTIFRPGKRDFMVLEKGKNAYSTLDSQAVSDPSTKRARRCLTWLIGREAVFSTWYGRKRESSPCTLATIPVKKRAPRHDTQPHTPAILRPDRPRHPFHPFVYVALIIDLPPARFNHPTLSFQARVIRV